MINRLVLQLNNKCNLICKFCYVNKGSSEIKFKTAQEAVDFLFSRSLYSDYKNKEIILMGGEPLLSRNVLYKIIFYIRNRYGIQPMIGMPSNLIVLTKEDLFFFQKMKVNLSWSVYDNWQKIIHKKKFLISTDIKSYLRIRFTVNSKSSDIINFYNNFLHFKKLGFKKFDICPVIGVFWADKNIKKFLGYYQKILLLSKKKKIKLVKLDDCYNNIIAKKTLAFCPRLNHEIFVDFDGKLYPCQWFSSLTEPQKESLRIGQIFENPELLKERIKKLAKDHISYRVCKEWKFSCSICNFSSNCHKFCLGHPAAAIQDSSCSKNIVESNLKLSNSLNGLIEKVAIKI